MRTKNIYLGDGFDSIKFLAFNLAMIIIWISLKVMLIYILVGADSIVASANENVVNSPLGMLGMSFVNITSGIPVIIMTLFILTVWGGGNAYIIRKEVYEFAYKHFRLGDL